MQQEMTARGQSFQVLVFTIPVYNICALNASQPTHPWHASVRNISFSVGWSCDKASPAKKLSFVCFGFLFYIFPRFLFPTWSMSVGLVVKSFLKRERVRGMVSRCAVTLSWCGGTLVRP